MNNEQRKILAKKYLDAYNFFDLKSLTLLIHEDIIFTSIVNESVIVKTHGIDEFIKFSDNLKKQLSLNKQTIRKLIWREKDLIVELDYEISIISDQKSDLKIGEILKQNGTIEFQFQDEKIITVVDSRNYVD